ncbi:hypothetical protein EYF80_057128 [Liparis tanakae]|uniref:Uncharacterized protein n=1 Tax=Liparis tanakae TaxID=230148 RepID=A0A4Z2EV72_9TELE|nr:hypothetical protein EYF80_057128 [Liparis tanakae]
MRENVHSAESSSCSDQAKLEKEFNLRDDFYGYFAAFIVSIYGHRPGVLTNMTVPEVEAAKVDRLRHHCISTNRDFGGAQIFLSCEEFTWLERWIQRRKFLGPKND